MYTDNSDDESFTVSARDSDSEDKESNYLGNNLVLKDLQWYDEDACLVFDPDHS